MILTVETIVLLVVLAIQFILALAAIIRRRNLSGRFATALGSRTNVAELLEKYNRVIGQLNIKVDAQVYKLPSQAAPGILLVNRRLVFETSLYHNYFTLFQIMLTRTEYSFVHKKSNYQLIGFLLELILLAVALGWFSAVSLFGTILGIILIIYSFYLESKLRRATTESLEIAADLLDLDPVEKARAVLLADRIRSEVFVYPLKFLIDTFKFIVPFWD